MRSTSLETQARISYYMQFATLVFMLSFLIIIVPARAQTNQGMVVSEIQEEKNKELVINFYHAVFTEKKVAEAFKKYAKPNYIQHSPLATDVRDTIAYLQAYMDGTPGHGWELKRALADGDLVALHVHSWSGPDDPGRAIVDIFRVEDGLVAEHWEVMQPVVRMEDRSMF